jgi:YesN/AraC family two-component response regulator
MPRMNGPDLVRALGETRPETKVLYLSGYASNAVFRQSALDSGVAFLQKPATPTSLLLKVREVLDG